MSYSLMQISQLHPMAEVTLNTLKTERNSSRISLREKVKELGGSFGKEFKM